MKKKLILRSSSERGIKEVLFIDRDLLINFQGNLCLRALDFNLDSKMINKLKSSIFAKMDIIIIHHAREVAMSWQTLSQLNEIDECLKELLLENHFKILDQINCIHDENADGNEALTISCSCHPNKGGMFLDSSIKHELSLSKSYYLFQKENYAEVAKRFGITTLSMNNI